MLSVKSHKEKGALLADSIFTALKKIPFDFEEKDFKGSNFT